MAAPKRTRTQRESDLVEIERLNGRGYTERQIAAKKGLARSQIHYDLVTIQRRYAETLMAEHHAAVVEKVEQLREVRRESWEAWEKSKENREKQVKEKVSETLDGNGQPNGDAVQKIRAVVTSEGQLPRK